jgi:hypothetical protein
MKYNLKIFDNYNSESYNYGEFLTYEEAELKAKEIVSKFFENYW